MNTKTILGISFTAVFAVSMIFAGTLIAAEATGNHSPSWRMTLAGASGDTLYIEVEANAGNVKPDLGSGDVYAYVWTLTDGRTFAVATHEFCDSNEQPQCGDTDPDQDWHGHQLAVEDSTSGKPRTCLDVPNVTDEGVAFIVSDTRVELRGVSIGTATVAGAATMQLTTTDEGQVCINHVYTQF